MIKSSDIVYEQGEHWVLKVKDGFEVYKIGITCSTRCSQIDDSSKAGLTRAINECKRRELNL